MNTKNWMIILLILALAGCASTKPNLEEKKEKDPRYQYNLGLFYLNNGMLDQSIEHLQKTLELEPKQALAYNALGLAFSMKGEMEKSVEYLNKALSINPRLTEAHNNLGSVYQEMGMPDQAEEHFLAAASDENYHSRELPLYNLGRLYMLKEENKRALNYTNRALAVNDKFVMALNLKGILSERFEQYQQAIDSYEKAIQLSSNDINLKFNLAGAYLKDGQAEAARDILLEIEPKATDPEMQENIANYLKMTEKKYP
jgi:type IV pilus biogenesis/stability protein PilW